MTTTYIDTVLDELGIAVINERGSERLAKCPGHKDRKGRDDANPSWWINADTGAHICFSCGFKGNLPFLVAYVRGITNRWGLLDFDTARRWIDQYEPSVAQAVTRISNDSYRGPDRKVYVPESELAVYVDPPEWARKARGLSLNSCSFYGVLWDEREGSWITPIRDPYTSKLMGWQAKGQKVKVFRNRPTGVQKSHTLFGIDRYVDGDMILVESPLDAVRLLSVGVRGGVAAFGAVLSEQQYLLLRRADRLIVAFDNPRIDAAGKAASEAMLDACKKYRFDCSFFRYSSDVKDVGAMSRSEILDGIKNARHSVYGRKAISV